MAGGWWDDAVLCVCGVGVRRGRSVWESDSAGMGRGGWFGAIQGRDSGGRREDDGLASVGGVVWGRPGLMD